MLYGHFVAQFPGDNVGGSETEKAIRRHTTQNIKCFALRQKSKNRTHQKDFELKLLFFNHFNHLPRINPTINPKQLYKQLSEEPGSVKISLENLSSRVIMPGLKSSNEFFLSLILLHPSLASVLCGPCELREQPACSFLIFLHS